MRGLHPLFIPFHFLRSSISCSDDQCPMHWAPYELSEVQWAHQGLARVGAKSPFLFVEWKEGRQTGTPKLVCPRNWWTRDASKQVPSKAAPPHKAGPNHQAWPNCVLSPKQAHLTTSPARWTRTLHSCASPFLVGEGRSQEWMSEESIRTTHMKMAKAGRVPQNTTRRWSTNNRCPISTIDASFTSIQLGCTEAEDAQPPTPALSHLFFLQTHEQPFPFQQDLVPPKATTSLEKSTDYQHHFLAPSPFLQDPNMKFPPTLPPTSENPNSSPFAFHLPSNPLPYPYRRGCRRTVRNGVSIVATKSPNSLSFFSVCFFSQI